MKLGKVLRGAAVGVAEVVRAHDDDIGVVRTVLGMVLVLGACLVLTPRETLRELEEDGSR